MEAEKQTNARVFDELSAHDSRIGQELLQQKVPEICKIENLTSSDSKIAKKEGWELKLFLLAEFRSSRVHYEGFRRACPPVK